METWSKSARLAERAGGTDVCATALGQCSSGTQVGGWSLLPRRKLPFDDRLKPPVQHALHIEGHPLRRRRHGRVTHHLLVDGVAVCLRLVDDEGEDDRLAGLGADALGKREAEWRLEVVADAFEVL